MGKFMHLEYIEHSEEDRKDFDMDNEATSIIEIDKIVFSLNHSIADKAEAQEEMRNQIKGYIVTLAEELKSL